MILNDVKIIGNLVSEPELRFTPNGTQVANLSVGINETYRVDDEQGDASRKGILRTFRPSKNHSSKINRSRTRLQLVLRENWCWDPLLCAGGSAFLMRCLRTPFREETRSLAYVKFRFLRRPLFARLFQSSGHPRRFRGAHRRSSRILHE